MLYLYQPRARIGQQQEEQSRRETSGPWPLTSCEHAWVPSECTGRSCSCISTALVTEKAALITKAGNRPNMKDVEDKCMVTKGERGGVGGIWRLGLTHIHY